MSQRIVWSGIEQWKYGLTARWYVSAFYGNDVDIDDVGLYHPTNNPTGHGGKERPFASINKAVQSGTGAIVLDSGHYMAVGVVFTAAYSFVGDGIVVIDRGGTEAFNVGRFCNCILAGFYHGGATGILTLIDCICSYGRFNTASADWLNTIFVESSISRSVQSGNIANCIFIRCSGNMRCLNGVNNIYINCSTMTFIFEAERLIGQIYDYSLIIGTVSSNRPINGKTTGVTIEDFKAHGEYFVKSYSEVDLFGNASGSGATVNQLNEIFNNYYSPVYIDDWQSLDLSLRPDADDRVKFGGLNGTYIGALPTGYRFSAADLWNTHKDEANTSNLQWDSVNQAIVIATGEDVGHYRSLKITLPETIRINIAHFFANIVYNADGTPRQGVANQRIDTTPDLEPDNTENQRVVYDFLLSYTDEVDGTMTALKNFELNAEPQVDNAGNTALDTAYNSAQRQKISVREFIVEFTMRRVIIE